jgi:hypothetical protein
MIGERVRDGVLTRLIGKWLKAGVMEQGRHERSETGTPQGGVISPLLANIFLHHVLDQWFEHSLRPGLRARSFMVRYADDVVMVFADKQDAQRCLQQLEERLALYGLELHPDKTRLVAFGKPAKDDSKGEDHFNFLGFTHYWAKSRRGYWVVNRKTAKDRLCRTLVRLGKWLKRHRHEPVRQQHKQLGPKLSGHYSYYGIRGNYRSLLKFYRRVERLWKYWLDRRSQRARMPWAIFRKLLKRFGLPKPRIVHSYAA